MVAFLKKTLWTVPLALLALARPGPAQIIKLDMGPTSKLPSQPGWTGMDDTGGTGIASWYVAPAYTLDRGTISPSGTTTATFHALVPATGVSENLITDSVGGPVFILQLDLSNTPDLQQGDELHLVFWIGDIGNIGTAGTGAGATPQSNGKILIAETTSSGQWAPTVLTSDAFAHTLATKASFDDARGGYKRLAFKYTLSQSPGDLFIKFRYEVQNPLTHFPASAAPFSLMGTEVYKHRAPSVTLAPQSPLDGLPYLVYSGSSTIAGEIVRSINVGVPLDGAMALGQYDPSSKSAQENLEVAEAAAWLIGWLGNYATASNLGHDAASWHSVDDVLLLDLEQTLDAVGADPVLGTSSTYVSLRSDFEHFMLGTLFARSLGYTSVTLSNPANELSNPLSLGGIFPNLAVAIQLFEQVHGDSFFQAADHSLFPESPFHLKAQYRVADLFHDQNANVKPGQCPPVMGVCFQDAIQYWAEIFGRVYDWTVPLDPAATGQLRPRRFNSPEIFVHAWTIQDIQQDGLIIGDAPDPAPANPLVGVPSADVYSDRELLCALVDDSNPADPRHAWWLPDVELLDSGGNYRAAAPCGNAVDATLENGAPDWADFQRLLHQVSLRAGQWWMEHRLFTSLDGSVLELGGGIGDDNEVLGGIASLTAGVTETERAPLESSLIEILEYLLNSSAVHPDQKFYDVNIDGDDCQSSDLEHSTEYTHVPFLLLRWLEYGAPRFVEATMASMRNLDDGAQNDCVNDPDPDWTEYDSVADVRHLRSGILGARKAIEVGGLEWDSTWTALLLEPGYFLVNPFGLSWMRDRTEEIARGWHAGAMFTDTSAVSTTNKLPGSIPGGIESSGVTGLSSLGDLGSKWWSEPGAAFSSIKAKRRTFTEMMEFLGVAARHSSSGPAPGDDPEEFLQYLAALIPDVLQADPSGKPEPGTQDWVAKNQGPGAAAAAFVAREQLLQTGSWGLTVAQLSDMAELHSGSYARFLFSNYIQYLDAPANPRGLPNELDSDDGVEACEFGMTAHFRRYSDFVQLAYPLLTTVPAFSDRAGFLPNDLTRSMSGMGSVQWYNPEDPNAAGYQPLDIAVVVTNLGKLAYPAQGAFLEALIYNFSSSADEVGFRLLENNFAAGLYRIGTETAPQPVSGSFGFYSPSGALTTCPPSGGVTGHQANGLTGAGPYFIRPGDRPELAPGIPLTLTVPAEGLLAVRIYQTGDPCDPVLGCPPEVDLAIDERDVVYDGTSLAVTIHNLGSAPYDASTYGVGQGYELQVTDVLGNCIAYPIDCSNCSAVVPPPTWDGTIASPGIDLMPRSVVFLPDVMAIGSPCGGSGPASIAGLTPPLTVSIVPPDGRDVTLANNTVRDVD